MPGVDPLDIRTPPGFNYRFRRCERTSGFAVIHILYDQRAAAGRKCLPKAYTRVHHSLVNRLFPLTACGDCEIVRNRSKRAPSEARF